MKYTDILKKIWRFRDKYLGSRRLMILLSFIIGMLGGLVAVLLKNIVHFTSQLVTRGWFTDRVNFLYFTLPLIGILLSVLYVKYFVKDNISHGISKILFAISKRNSYLKPHNTYSSLIASTLTVGFGGSVGLEAPIVLTGSAIGSTVSRFMHLDYRTTTLMLGCGAAGAIAEIFAPALFMGGITGFIVSRIINGFELVKVSERNFTLVGMAGIMAGVMHAPLTAIFLIAELTGGYGLFMQLIVTASIAYLTVIYFEPHSLYTHRLAKRGELITHHKDRAILTLLTLDSVIEKDLKTISSDAKLGDLVKVISVSNRNIFPVLDDQGMLEGIILLDNIRDIIFKQSLYEKVKVSEFMVAPPAVVSPKDSMTVVMQKFEETGAWNLPVTDNGKYVGFISKSRIFNVYRKLLVQFYDE